MLAVTMAQSILNAMSRRVFLYRFKKLFVVKTRIKELNWNVVGKNTYGSSWMDSPAVLNEVRIIHTNGIIMVSETTIRIACSTRLEVILRDLIAAS
jgi:hypothetical protein